jgi:hypothetical protein
MPAGIRCIQLTPDNLCRIFGKTERPAVCSGLRHGEMMCGRSNAEALAFLAALEHSTRSSAGRAKTLPFASPEGTPHA